MKQGVYTSVLLVVVFCFFTGWCHRQYPLGLSAGIITENNVKGSSNDNYDASEARLRNNYAWEPNESDKNAHITINLGELVLISGVATQGFNDDGFSGRITRYKVRYSYDGQAWYKYTYLNNSDKASCKHFYYPFSSRKISFPY